MYSLFRDFARLYNHYCTAVIMVHLSLETPQRSKYPVGEVEWKEVVSNLQHSCRPPACVNDLLGPSLFPCRPSKIPASAPQVPTRPMFELGCVSMGNAVNHGPS